jgi:Cof subfamily protein (haloacid dehalogenase superfamily)
MPIQLIATDLDGTFFDSKSRLIPENVEAFRQARAAGIAVAISSGRCPKDIAAIHREMGFETLISAYNGAVVRDPQKNTDIFYQPLETATLLALLEILESFGIFYNVCTLKGRYLYALGQDRERAEAFSRSMNARGIPTGFIDDHRALNEDGRRDCLKVIAMAADKASIDRVREAVMFSGLPITLTASWWNNIEVVAPTVDKGAGILHLCRYLNIDPVDVMVLGDQKNDLPMFEVAGCPVAMGNADDEVKQIAKYVTSTNDEAGVARAVRQYALCR